MERKYELTNETKTLSCGTVVRRIRALRDIGRDVRAGDLGGWIESEKNLSYAGNCWVSGNARVSGNAWVFGNARVSGNAWVFGNARVSGNARVFGNARVSGNARVFDNAQVFGNALVSGNALVYGNASVRGDASVSKASDWACVGPLGREGRFLTATKDDKVGLRLSTGCFSGSPDEFRATVKETHGDGPHAATYMAALALLTRLTE